LPAFRSHDSRLVFEVFNLRFFVAFIILGFAVHARADVTRTLDAAFSAQIEEDEIDAFDVQATYSGANSLLDPASPPSLEITAVPEASSLTFLGMFGGIGLAAARRRRKKTADVGDVARHTA